MKNVADSKKTPLFDFSTIDLSTEDEKFKIKEAKAIAELKQRSKDEYNKECKEWLANNPRKRKVPGSVTSYFKCHNINAAIEYGERAGWERMYKNYSEYFFGEVGHHLYNTI